jgi:hypothetical protein
MFARSQLGAVWRQTQEWNSRQVSSWKENIHPEAPEVQGRRRSVGSPFHPVNPQFSPTIRPFSPNIRPAQPPLYPSTSNRVLPQYNGPVRVPPQSGVPFMPELQLSSLPALDERAMYMPALPTAAPQLLQ